MEKGRASSSGLAASLLPDAQGPAAPPSDSGLPRRLRVDPPPCTCYPPTTTPGPRAPDVDAQLLQHLRRLGRKDPTTKLKALSSLSVLFAQQPADQVVQIVPQWALLYFATNDTMSSLVTSETFVYLNENLKLTAQALSDKVISSSLLAMATLIDILLGVKLQNNGGESANTESKSHSKVRSATLSSAEAALSMHKYFIDFLKSKSAAIRSATYTLLTSYIKYVPHVFSEEAMKTLSSTLLGAFNEKDPLCHSAMWDTILVFSRKFPEAWSYCNIHKVILNRFWHFLQNGCYGSKQASYPLIVQFLDVIPSKEVATEKFAIQFLQNLWAGRHQRQLSAADTSAFFNAFKQSFLWLLKKVPRNSVGDSSDNIHNMLIANVLVKIVWHDYLQLSLSKNLDAIPGLLSEEATTDDHQLSHKSLLVPNVRLPIYYYQDLGKCIVEILDEISVAESHLLEVACESLLRDYLDIVHQGEKLSKFQDHVDQLASFFCSLDLLVVQNGRTWPLENLARPLVVHSLPAIKSMDSPSLVKLLINLVEIFGPAHLFLKYSEKMMINHMLRYHLQLKIDLLLLMQEECFDQWCLIIKYIIAKQNPWQTFEMAQLLFKFCRSLFVLRIHGEDSVSLIFHVALFIIEWECSMALTLEKRMIWCSQGRNRLDSRDSKKSSIAPSIIIDWCRLPHLFLPSPEHKVAAEMTRCTWKWKRGSTIYTFYFLWFSMMKTESSCPEVSIMPFCLDYVTRRGIFMHESSNLGTVQCLASIAFLRGFCKLCYHYYLHKGMYLGESDALVLLKATGSLFVSLNSNRKCLRTLPFCHESAIVPSSELGPVKKLAELLGVKLTAVMVGYCCTKLGEADWCFPGSVFYESGLNRLFYLLKKMTDGVNDANKLPHIRLRIFWEKLKPDSLHPRGANIYFLLNLLWLALCCSSTMLTVSMNPKLCSLLDQEYAETGSCSEEASSAYSFPAVVVYLHFWELVASFIIGTSPQIRGCTGVHETVGTKQGFSQWAIFNSFFLGANIPSTVCSLLSTYVLNPLCEVSLVNGENPQVNVFVAHGCCYRDLQRLPLSSTSRALLLSYVQDKISPCILDCIFQHIPLRSGKDAELVPEAKAAAEASKDAIVTCSLLPYVESLWPVGVLEMASLAGSFIRFTSLRDRSLSSSIESFLTRAWCSPPLLLDEFWSGMTFILPVKESVYADADILVSVNRHGDEIIATYKKEETGIDLGDTKLPSCYLIRRMYVEVECTRSLGSISEVKCRKMVAVADAASWRESRTGAAAEAIRTWKNNLTRSLRGWEECPICYSIQALHQQPRAPRWAGVARRKDKFHASACLQVVLSPPTSPHARYTDPF
ncbi:hypothetical protein ZWY2020_028360 [Hordeum vulgare]|nr:hypothetical protein ZWY2020_028360 [Hordeum vulgare]